MPVTISVRFPHGRYLATAWINAANSGDVEWPPSPWRLARALLSVWYTRRPDIDSEVIGEVLDVLREPPRYWLPPVGVTHSRHYIPQTSYQTAAKHDTTQTLDAWIDIDPAQALLVTWPNAEPTPRARQALADLLTSLPYLGRAGSDCQACLVPEGVELLIAPEDPGWCAPEEFGINQVLCLGADTTREDLELRPDEMGAAKRLVPQGGRWVTYSTPVRSREQRRGTARDLDMPSVKTLRSQLNTKMQVLRWRLTSPAPFLAHNGLHAVEGLRAGRMARLRADDIDDPALHGHRERDESGRLHSFDAHEQAHWLWLEGAQRPSGSAFEWVPSVAAGAGWAPPRRVVRDVALWVPEGIEPGVLNSLLAGELLRPEGYSPRGYVPSGLQLVALGSAAECLPEVTTTGATEWVSATPFLTFRHRRKGQSLPEFVAANVEREWSRRQVTDEGPQVVDVAVLDEDFNACSPSGRGWAAQYRRRRWLLPSQAARSRGIGNPTYESMVRVRFDRPITGPLSLGGLSHFGFGLFMPMRGA